MDLDLDATMDQDPDHCSPVNIANYFDKIDIQDQDEDEDEDEDKDEEFEFSFDGGEIKSPVSAEEVFHNGQIRPTTPFTAVNSDEKPVKNVFVVTSMNENGDVVVEGPVGPEMSRKSNSTGFSRLRKMKDLLVRSNSDGKDTFVFLTKKEGGEKDKDTKMKKEKKTEKKTMMAAYESLYGGGKNKEKKGGDKSYLPYKVGFFTNVTSITKNVHPY